MGPQLNSTCSLKSLYFPSLISSGPLPGVINFPFSTFQTAFESDLLIVHPDRFFPLNSGTGFPHFTVPLLFNSGARTPVHGQTTPFGPVVVPVRASPFSVASKTISSLRSSSSFGETNFRWPFVISAAGNGRAFPQRPTISAFNWPFSCRNSSQEGYSRSGAFNVKSQRPRKGSADTAGPEEEVATDLFPPEQPRADSNVTRITVTKTIL